MPELPEVETIRLGLLPKVKGKTIKKVEIFKSTVIKDIAPSAFVKLLTNKKILNIKRRAKYLIFELSGDHVLLVHLGMAGALILGDKAVPAGPLRREASRQGQKYNQFSLHLSKGLKLYYCDSRLFGKVRLIQKKQLEHFPLIAKLGPEPLDGKLSDEDFHKMLHSKNRMIKPLLLDQTFIAGIGNIYASEALFEAGIHPKRASNKISPKEAAKLHKAIKNVLLKSIKKGGSSVDRYVDASGEKGKMQLFLKVYDRKGEKCVKCAGRVEKISLGQRGTYFCSKCQK